MSTLNRGNLKMAVMSLRSAKWRSLLTMLGIIIGIVSVVTIVGIGEGMKHQIAGQVNHFGNDLITVRPGKVVMPDAKHAITTADTLFGYSNVSGLTERDLSAAKKAENVGKVAPLGVVSGVATNQDRKLDDGVVIATSPDLPELLNQKVRYGGFFNDDSELSGAVIGRQVAYKLFDQSVPLGKTFVFRGQSFTVRGIMEDFKSPPLSPTNNFDNVIFIPYQMAGHLTNGSTQYYSILAKPDTGVPLDTAMYSIKQNMAEARGGQHDFTVLNQEQSKKMSSGIIDLLTGFITAVAAISLLVGGIGIMNIMLVSVTERMHEIGIRKAVGATNQQIWIQFMLESTVLSAIGGIVGVTLAIIVDILLRTYTTYEPIISWEAILIATAVSVAVGVVFGTAPAIKAARKDPIEALRHE